MRAAWVLDAGPNGRGDPGGDEHRAVRDDRGADRFGGQGPASSCAWPTYKRSTLGATEQWLDGIPATKLAHFAGEARVTEAFRGFSAWLRFGGEAIGRNDPGYQEKIIKFNELLANCVIYSHACDLTAAANALACDGHPIDTDDLATISSYITHTIRRFGDWVLDLSPPDAVPVTTLDLVPGALFPGDITAATAPAATAPRRTRRCATSKKGS